MGAHYLKRVFEPRSIAVIGANDSYESAGGRVFANLLAGEYNGAAYAINIKHQEVQGQPCYPSLEATDAPIDLAILATPAATTPELLRQCGEHGVAGAVVLASGFQDGGSKGKRLLADALHTLQRYDTRLLGPRSLGLMRPQLGLNASFSRNTAQPGNLALVSESDAVCTAILDWAQTRQIGFSAVVSLGEGADLEVADVLDFLAQDRHTRSILLYVEQVSQARRFVSSLRLAARLKPVIAVRAGRFVEITEDTAEHIQATADDIFDAVLERTGAVRACSIQDLFSAAQALSSGFHAHGNRLAILSNGAGPGIMAADRARELNLRLAQFSEATHKQLLQILPAHETIGNPLDLRCDASADVYGETLAACLHDPNVDGVLTMLSPQALSDVDGAAEAVLQTAHGQDKAVLTCWMGAAQVSAAHEHFREQHVPSFTTPDSSVQAFSYLANYWRGQQMLLQVPGPLGEWDEPDAEGARLIIENILAEGRRQLSAMEAKAVLTAFRIPVNRTAEARSPNEALIAAESMGFPVAVKIGSAQLSHKSDVGGVRLNVADAVAVRNAFHDLFDQIKRVAPDLVIDSVTVERMYNRPNGRELRVRVFRDPVFGPVVSFSAGGLAVEILRDRAVALPPLNHFIIQRMIEKTQVAHLLGEFRNMPPVHLTALYNTLQRVSEMVCELPEIVALDIDPLIADEHGVLAVDARMTVALPRATMDRYAHMAIHPYPTHLIYRWQLPDGADVTIRPIRPEDAEIEAEFVRKLSPETKYSRFMQAIDELTPSMLVRFTQIDYDREMAFIATTEVQGATEEIGVARYTTNPDGESCEFALVIADAWQKRGIGSRLMHALIQAARGRGLRSIEGEILSDNVKMLGLMKMLGFTVHTSEEDPGIKVAVRKL